MCTGYMGHAPRVQPTYMQKQLTDSSPAYLAATMAKSRNFNATTHDKRPASGRPMLDMSMSQQFKGGNQRPETGMDGGSRAGLGSRGGQSDYGSRPPSGYSERPGSVNVTYDTRARQPTGMGYRFHQRQDRMAPAGVPNVGTSNFKYQTGPMPGRVELNRTHHPQYTQHMC